MGVVTAHGRGVEALWKGLAASESGVRDHSARFGGRTWIHYPMARLVDDTDTLADDLPGQAIVQHEGLRRDPDLVAIAESMRQAIADAGLTYDPDHNDVGLMVTHESPGLGGHLKGFFNWGETFRAWLGSPARFDPPEFLYRLKSESVYRLHSFLYVHHLSALFQLHGFSLYNNNACASGAYALSVAADRIASGDLSAAVVAGGDVPEDGTKYRWFRDLGLYSSSGTCRPFHAERDGLVLGSGAAALVLEDLERARAAGKRIHAEWLGGGFTSDGWKITMPDVAGDRYTEAMRRALRAARVKAEDVSLIAPHGVGSAMLDHFEANSLAQVFSSGDRPWPPILVGKAALGHTLGGCALVETVLSVMALERREIPEVVQCLEPDPSLPLGAASDDPLPEDWVLFKCTNGFAGQNAAIVLRSPD